MRGWYVIFTKPKQEAVADLNLTRQGYHTYFPKCYRWGAKRTQGIEALFPRYIFVNIDVTHDNWAPIRSTSGVNRLVSFGGFPASVPDAFLDSLRGNEDQSGIQRRSATTYKPGDQVTIAGGLFAGYDGTYLALSGRERVTLLLELAGTSIQLELKTEEVELRALG